MVHEDNQTIGNGSSRAYKGTEIPKACVKCSTEHVGITQVGPWLSQTRMGTDGPYLPNKETVIFILSGMSLTASLLEKSFCFQTVRRQGRPPAYL